MIGYVETDNEVASVFPNTFDESYSIVNSKKVSQHLPALRALKRALGKKVVTDREECLRQGIDNARLVFEPSAVIRIDCEDDIAVVLRLANKHTVPVTVRAAGSCATGGASPSDGGWVLDVNALNSIRIDANTGIAHVGAGAVNADINTAAEAKGWFYPPDPSSKNYATIGGNIATNAGGLRGAKYGVTRDYVLGLEGFMPTGEFVRWGAPLRKFVSGYNVRDLWVGSEGMLGVVTSASLRLIPKPEVRKTYLFAYRTDAQALKAAQAVIRERITPAVMEFLDRQTVGGTLIRRREMQVPNGLLEKVIRGFRAAPALLLIDLDGTREVVRRDHKRLIKLLEADNTPCAAARNDDESEELWNVRRTCSQAMYQHGDTKLNEDIVVPVESYLPLLKYTLELKKNTGLATPTFGHAADGNFHVHVMFNHRDEEQAAKAEDGIYKLMKKVVELGGAITGEHGIGLAKSPFMELQHTPEEIDVMRRVKAAFDPNNILNPGKMFEPFEMWKHPHNYDAVLPWDKKH